MTTTATEVSLLITAVPRFPFAGAGIHLYLLLLPVGELSPCSTHSIHQVQDQGSCSRIQEFKFHVPRYSLHGFHHGRADSNAQPRCGTCLRAPSSRWFLSSPPPVCLTTMQPSGLTLPGWYWQPACSSEPAQAVRSGGLNVSVA